MTLQRIVVSFSLAIFALGIAMGQIRTLPRPMPNRPAPDGARTSPAATMPAVDAEPSVPAKPAAPAPLKIYLMDGSIVTGKISVPELAIDTQFGSLKVPFESIRAFTPGLSSHPEFTKKLGDLVNDLAADGFAERENAQRALVKLGPEIAPELRLQVKTAQAEKLTRLQKILDEFDSQHDANDEDAPTTSGEWTNDDVIVTNTFTIVGHITTPGFAVSNTYGTLQLKMDDIRRGQRDIDELQDIHKTITVSGNVISNNSFESAIKVNRGDRISITATGTVTMSPWGGNASTGPDGSPNYGSMGSIPTGALIAKIGTGSIFKAGSKYNFVADKAGMLEFGIAMPGNYSGNTFPGEYQVKIRITRK